MGGCAGMGMVSAQNSSLSHAIETMLSSAARIAPHFIVFITSGPVLGFLIALILLLTVVALTKFIFFGRTRRI